MTIKERMREGASADELLKEFKANLMEAKAQLEEENTQSKKIEDARNAAAEALRTYYQAIGVEVADDTDILSSLEKMEKVAKKFDSIKISSYSKKNNRETLNDWVKSLRNSELDLY